MKPSTSTMISRAVGSSVRALIWPVSCLVLLLISAHCSALESSSPSSASPAPSGEMSADGRSLFAASNKAVVDRQNKVDERPLRSQSAATNKRDPSSSSSSAVAAAGSSIEEPHGLESKSEGSLATPLVRAADSDREEMATAAGHHYGKSSHHGGHGKYYMYAESPKKGAYKMGFKRGNHKHMIERKESAHKSHVHSYFKWHDKKGKGSHKFEFKHGHHKGKHSGHY